MVGRVGRSRGPPESGDSSQKIGAFLQLGSGKYLRVEHINGETKYTTVAKRGEKAKREIVITLAKEALQYAKSSNNQDLIGKVTLQIEKLSERLENRVSGIGKFFLAVRRFFGWRGERDLNELKNLVESAKAEKPDLQNSVEISQKLNQNRKSIAAVFTQKKPTIFSDKVYQEEVLPFKSLASSLESVVSKRQVENKEERSFYTETRPHNSITLLNQPLNRGEKVGDIRDTSLGFQVTESQKNAIGFVSSVSFLDFLEPVKLTLQKHLTDKQGLPIFTNLEPVIEQNIGLNADRGISIEGTVKFYPQTENGRNQLTALPCELHYKMQLVEEDGKYKLTTDRFEITNEDGDVLIEPQKEEKELIAKLDPEEKYQILKQTGQISSDQIQVLFPEASSDVIEKLEQGDPSGLENLEDFETLFLLRAIYENAGENQALAEQIKDLLAETAEGLPEFFNNEKAVEGAALLKTLCESSVIRADKELQAKLTAAFNALNIEGGKLEREDTNLMLMALYDGLSSLALENSLDPMSARRMNNITELLTKQNVSIAEYGDTFERLARGNIALAIERKDIESLVGYMKSNESASQSFLFALVLSDLARKEELNILIPLYDKLKQDPDLASQANAVEKALSVCAINKYRKASDLEKGIETFLKGDISANTFERSIVNSKANRETLIYTAQKLLWVATHEKREGALVNVTARVSNFIHLLEQKNLNSKSWQQLEMLRGLKNFGEAAIHKLRLPRQHKEDVKQAIFLHRGDIYRAFEDGKMFSDELYQQNLPRLSLIGATANLFPQELSRREGFQSGSTWSGGEIKRGEMKEIDIELDVGASDEQRELIQRAVSTSFAGFTADLAQHMQEHFIDQNGKPFFTSIRSASTQQIVPNGDGGIKIIGKAKFYPQTMQGDTNLTEALPYELSYEITARKEGDEFKFEVPKFEILNKYGATLAKPLEKERELLDSLSIEAKLEKLLALDQLSNGIVELFFPGDFLQLGKGEQIAVLLAYKASATKKEMEQAQEVESPEANITQIQEIDSSLETIWSLKKDQLLQAFSEEEDVRGLMEDLSPAQQIFVLTTLYDKIVEDPSKQEIVDRIKEFFLENSYSIEDYEGYQAIVKIMYGVDSTIGESKGKDLAFLKRVFQLIPDREENFAEFFVEALNDSKDDQLFKDLERKAPVKCQLSLAQTLTNLEQVKEPILQKPRETRRGSLEELWGSISSSLGEEKKALLKSLVSQTLPNFLLKPTVDAKMGELLNAGILLKLNSENSTAQITETDRGFHVESSVFFDCMDVQGEDREVLVSFRREDASFDISYDGETLKIENYQVKTYDGEDNLLYDIKAEDFQKTIS